MSKPCEDEGCPLDRPHDHVEVLTEVAPRQPVIEPEHLGDGVYVSFDGYQLWLAVNDHNNKVVALEPGVVVALLAYARRIWPIA